MKNFKMGTEFSNNRKSKKMSNDSLKQPRFVEKRKSLQETKNLEEREVIPINDFLNKGFSLKFKREVQKPIETEECNSDKNSRCVSVDTISPAPEGRRAKKGALKAKRQLVKFRCTNYEKKILLKKAERCGISLSEFLRRIAMEQTTVERLTDEEIELYKMLVKYHNNFKSIGNMFKGKNDSLTNMVYDTAKEIKMHLKKFSK